MSVKLIVRAMISSFFRRVEVDGIDRLPSNGAVITVTNHANGLVDGLLLMSVLPRWPRFLGKATLFRIAPLEPLLELTGVIPVHRIKDSEPGDAHREAQNEETFAACRGLLRSGDMVSIFPEGISHDHESLQPLRTGAARIALGAAFDSEPHVELQIVPIGLAYDAKTTFRSNAVVTIGDPITVEQWADSYATDPRGAVRSCTVAINAGLRSVSPDFPHLEPTDATVGRVRFRAALRSAATAAPRPALMIAAPVALVGAVVHALPYQIVRQLARLPRGNSTKSTIKLLGCTTLFSLEWISLGTLAWRLRGRLAGLVTLFAAPVSGYVAVRFAETVRDEVPAR